MNLLTHDDLVSRMCSSQQASADKILDQTIGGILRAIVESDANVAIWLQSLIATVVALTRASSSTGADLDTFVGDYGITRLPAIVATGQVTFSRFVSTSQATIPVDATIASTDGNSTFVVIEDTDNVYWDADAEGYVVPIGTTSASVPVACTEAGVIGNVATNTITVITSSIPNIDTVTNALAFTNGIDEEADTALRNRFIAYFSSLSKATEKAIEFSITSVQQQLDYNLVEHYQSDGVYTPGFFYGVIDNGTGSPSSTLISDVYNSVESTRAFGVSFGIIAPTVIDVPISLSVTVASGYNSTSVKAAVQTAILNYINTLGLGEGLAYTRISQLAYAASAGVTNVTDGLLNSGTSDITCTEAQILKSSTVTVS